MEPIHLSLTANQISQLESIAKQALPNESCAFLLGRAAGDWSNVIEIMPMTNADSTPFSFSIAPAELLRAYEEAERRNLQVIGIFHSHPAPASPSATDTKYMALNPVAWLIYSTTEQNFGAFINDGGVRRLQISVTD